MGIICFVLLLFLSLSAFPRRSYRNEWNLSENYLIVGNERKVGVSWECTRRIENSLISHSVARKFRAKPVTPQCMERDQFGVNLLDEF